MRRNASIAILNSAALFLCALAPLRSANLPESKPEDVGVSKERLGRIHDTMESHIASHDITGAVTLVMRRGKVVNFEAHGLADVDQKKAMTRDAVFRIWSMSKVVTGTAILMLMEEGKVRLTDPISRFVPEYKGQKVATAQERGAAAPPTTGPATPQFYLVPAQREITVQDLLTHVSGLGSGPMSSSEIRKFGDRPGKSLGEYIPHLGTTPLEFQPGSRWLYSPLAGFDTLGRIVEVASGMTFDAFLKQRIFDPLGMKDSGFGPAGARQPRIPTTYHRAANQITKTEAINNLYEPGYFSGGGGLMSTAEDYAKFAQMLLDGGQGNGKRLLSPKTIELMASVFVPDTLPGRSPGKAFGLSVQVITNPVTADERVSKGSFGWDGAYGTHFWIDPKEKIVGIMMIQVDNPNRQVDRDFENAVMQAVVE